MNRAMARGSLALAVASAASVMMIAPSGATVPAQTCKKLTGVVTISPGLTTKPGPQKATAKGNLSTCTVKSRTGGSGTIAATLKLASNSSCQGLATGKQTVKLTAKVTWKNRKLTYLTLTARTGSGKTATVATITGTVSKGLFARHKVTAQIKVAPKSGENCTPGHPIRHLTFTNTKPFVIH